MSQDIKLGLPANHTQLVTKAEFSKNGTYFFTTSIDGSIKIRDVKSGKILNTIIPTKNVSYTSFTADGKNILTIGLFDGAKIWNIETGETISSFNLDSYGISPKVSFAHNQNLMILTGYKKPTILFNYKSGIEVAKLIGHKGYVNDFLFTKDDKKVITVSDDSTIKIWKTSNGELLETLEGHKDTINSVDISKDGKTLLTTSIDKEVILWDIKTKTIKSRIQEQGSKYAKANFNHNGDLFLIRNHKKELHIRSTKTSKIVQTLKGHKEEIFITRFSPDGKTILTLSYDIINLWDIKTGNIICSYSKPEKNLRNVYMNPDGNNLLLLEQNGPTKMLNTNTFKQLYSHSRRTHWIYDVAFNSNNTKILTNYSGNRIYLWDLKTGKLDKKLIGHIKKINSAKFSNDGKYIITTSDDTTICIWDTETGERLSYIIGNSSEIEYGAISPDNTTVLTLSKKKVAKLWDFKTGHLIKILGHSFDEIDNVIYNPSMNNILTINSDGLSKLWDSHTGDFITHSIKINSYIKSIDFNSEGTKLLTNTSFNSPKIWDLKSKKVLKTNGTLSYKSYFSKNRELIFSYADGLSVKDRTIEIIDSKTGKKSKEFNGHSNSILSADVSYDQKHLISSSKDGSLIIWDIKTGKQVLQHFIFDFDPNKWVHLHPSGLFDASPEAMKLMYWTKGLDVIEFEQIKEFYWEPGLWTKIMKEAPLKEVPNIQDLKLPPEIALGEINSNTLPIHIKKLDGGYGNLSIFVNDVLVTNLKNQIDNKLEQQTINYKFDPKSDLTKGKNTIRVIAESKDGLVKSRGAIGQYINTKKDPDINFYGIFVGVENYPIDDMDLSFPVKDVQALSKAVSTGANNLYTNKTHIYKLTSNHSHSDSLPNKKNIKRVFEMVQSKAKVDDIVFVYLSGHGVTFHKEGQSEFLFLPEDATSIDLNKYQNDFIRKNQTISGNEINEWLYKNKANKRVMILDACGSGKYTDNQKKSIIDPSREKTLREMAEVSGLSILVSSSADKASYESSTYGQGLLTYAILEGLKQKTQDNKVRSYPIMQHAQQRVPELADGISAQQKPELYGDASITFGILNQADKDEIILPTPKKIMVLPQLSNAKLKYGEDDLELSEMLSQRLIVYSDEKNAAIRYIPQLSYSNAYKINGTYLIEGSNYNLALKMKRKNTKDITTSLNASNPEELIELTINWIRQSLKD